MGKDGFRSVKFMKLCYWRMFDLLRLVSNSHNHSIGYVAPAPATGIQLAAG